MHKTTFVTQRGYDCYEVISALQKEIRRGKEENAMFWALELESFKEIMVWDRLRVIASEDVGIASPFLTVAVETLRKQYFETKGDARRLFLAHAVIMLAKSPKSRIVDDLLNTVYLEINHENKKLNMPNYALDKHTLRGMKMGRGWEYFFTYGCKLENETKTFKNTYTERAKELLKKYVPDKSKRKEEDKEMHEKQVPQKDLSKFVKKD